MILSQQLWHKLKHPPQQHPVYQRYLGINDRPIPWYIGCVELIAFLLIVPIIVFPGGVYSIAWAVGVSGILAQERSYGRYDLLSLAPAGPLMLNWAVVTACLYRNSTYPNINTRESWFARIVITSLLLFAFTSTAEPVRQMNMGVLMASLTIIGAFVAAIYIDHTHSIVLSNIIGMLVPTYTTNTFNAQLTAFTAFISMQLITYLSAFILLFEMLPPILGDHWLAQILRIVISLAFFFAIREAMIASLWRLLQTRLHTGDERL